MKRHGLTALMTCLIVACLTAKADDQREWTAVGDDENTGTATGHMMALSQDSVAIVSADLGRTVWNTDNVTLLNVGGWDTTATNVIFIRPDATPLQAGEQQIWMLPTAEMATGLWFASIKAFDERPNWAPMGNIARFTLYDVTSPAGIFDLK